MSWWGLPPATLLSLGAAVAAVLIGLHLLRERRRAVTVAFSALWASVQSSREASRWWRHLRRLLSLLVALLLALLLLTAAGDPRRGLTESGGRSLVVLVDASASMATREGAVTRLDLARDRVLALARDLGPDDRVLLAQLDATVTPLTAFTESPEELQAAAARLAPTATAANLDVGLGFARDALRGAPRPEIWLLSDGALQGLEAALGGAAATTGAGSAAPDRDGTAPPPPSAPGAGGLASGDTAGVRHLRVGTEEKNLAITAFSVRRYPLDKTRAEVLVEVVNTGPAAEAVELTLLGDGEVIEVTRREVAAGERWLRTVEDLGGAGRTLEAQVRRASGEADALALDDRAFALMPERRRARIAVISRGNTWLEAALLLDEYLDVTWVAPTKYPPAGSFDVTILDGVAPPPAPGAGALLYLGTPAEGAPVKHGRALTGFGFDAWDEKSALLRWIALGDVQVERGHTLAPAPGDRVLGRSEHGPILVAGRREGRAFVALGFDPRDSDFVLRPAWPLFLLGVIDAFVESDTTWVSGQRTGEVWRLAVPDTATVATLVEPSGARRTLPVQHGRALVRGEQVGFHRLEVAGTEPVLIAANLVDPDESRIAPRGDASAAATPPPPPGRFGLRRELWPWLVAAAIALSLLEWVGHHRRVLL